MNGGIKVFNFIRNNSTEAFVQTIPEATTENIQTISNILFNDAYQPMLNEFVTNLINRIALTIVRNKSFNNPLKVFKKGSVPLGTDIQEIFTNPAIAEQYELNNTAMAKLLTITDPDTHVAYYRRNRQSLYTKTIPRETLQGAFVSWEKFNEYVTSITTSLYSGNYIDEFKYTKDLINGAYINNKAIIETIANPTDEASAKAFLKKARALYSNLSFPSTDYNAYSKFSGAKGTITTWTEPERVVLIIKSDVLAEVDVEALASAFNIDKADFMGRVVPVDKFDNDEILGVICDESWLQIYDNLFRFDEFYNARVMAWNEYLHAWSTYAISPFSNAVILATKEPVASTNVAFGVESAELNLNDTPNYETLEITLTPKDSTDNVEFTSSNPLVFTATKIDDTHVTLTPMSVGTGTIIAKTSSGKTASASITVKNE